LEFAPGAIGGFFNVFVGYPMDLIKVRQQSSGVSRTAVAATLAAAPTSTSGMLKNILAQEGMTGLYRGVASPLLAVTPAFAVSFWSCDVAKAFMISCEQRQQPTFGKDDLTLTQVAAAGGFSGIPLAMVVGPSERIKCLMQVDKTRYSGFLDCAGQVYREGGMQSVFRGTGSCVLRDVPGNAAYFAGYELCRRQLCAWEGRESPSTPSILLAGGMAGVANWVVAIPFDTIKSRIQTAPSGMYKNYMDVLTQTVQNEGFTALFRGLTPALLRAFPANAACLFGVETARSFFESMR
jgi:solute carrier family 25 (mitochondrial carnitine/acylcarnitine transporter), member 20/29